MDYAAVYKDLMVRAKHRTMTEYTERHHIIPRCLGGSDEVSNLVDLTPEEHFLAHRLLVRIYPNNTKLIFALQAMTRSVSGRKSRKLFGLEKRLFSQRMSESQTGKGNSQFGSFWITDGNKNQKLSKGSEVPSGWKTGRCLPSVQRTCKLCETILNSKTSQFCENHRRQVQSENNRKNVKFLRGSYDGKKFITNGNKDKLHPVNLEIPEGWRWGRSNNKTRENQSGD